MNAIIIYIFIYVAALRERRKKREEEEKSQQTPLKTTIDPSTSVNPLSTTKIAACFHVFMISYILITFSTFRTFQISCFSVNKYRWYFEMASSLECLM